MPYSYANTIGLLASRIQATFYLVDNLKSYFNGPKKKKNSFTNSHNRHTRRAIHKNMEIIMCIENKEKVR